VEELLPSLIAVELDRAASFAGFFRASENPRRPQFRLSLAHMVFLHFGKNLPRISSSVKYARTWMSQHSHAFDGKRERNSAAQVCDSVISL
jgi:hypothetical protein